MSEREPALAESEAKELLHLYLGKLAATGEVNSYDDFLEVVDGIQLPIALSSMIVHNGKTNRKIPGFSYVQGRNNGWNIVASDTNNDGYQATVVTRHHRKFGIGPREKSVFLIHDADIKTGVAFEYSTSTHGTYFVNHGTPEFQNAAKKMGNERIYSFHGDSTIPSNITTPEIMGAEAQLRTAETLTGFLRISGQLVDQFLAVTA